MNTLPTVRGALCAAVLSVLALLVAVAPAAAAAPAGFELRPGVVADAAGSTLYVMQPEGGIAALEVATGRELWTTDAAARPLYADDEVLVAQVETPGRFGMLNLAVFDVRRPQARPAIESVEMPAGTQALVVDGRKATFDLWATREGDAVLVGWTYTRNEKTAVEAASRNAAARHMTKGAVRMPLGRGPLREVAAEDAPNPKSAPLPAALPTLDGYASEMAALAVGGGVRPAGDTFALVELPTRNPRSAGLVRRWEASGAALPAYEVFGDGALIKLRSADGRYLLGSMRTAGNTADARYAWTLVDLVTGQPVANFEHADSAAAFFLVADRVIVDRAPRARPHDGEMVWQPLAIEGLDRATGAVRWTRAIRDTAYSGDLPPAR